MARCSGIPKSKCNEPPCNWVKRKGCKKENITSQKSLASSLSPTIALLIRKVKALEEKYIQSPKTNKKTPNNSFKSVSSAFTSEEVNRLRDEFQAKIKKYDESEKAYNNKISQLLDQLKKEQLQKKETIDRFQKDKDANASKLSKCKETEVKLLEKIGKVQSKLKDEKEYFENDIHILEEEIEHMSKQINKLVEIKQNYEYDIQELNFEIKKLLHIMAP